MFYIKPEYNLKQVKFCTGFFVNEETMKAVFSCSRVCLQRRIYSFTHTLSTNKRFEVTYVLAGFTFQIF